MAADWLQQLIEATWLSSLAIVAIAALRRPLRAALGARAAYALWLALPLVLLTSLGKV